MALTKLDKNLLGFSDDTDFIKLPSGTTAQRPSSAAAGQFRFNTTIGDVEVYNGAAWTRMGTAPPTFSSVDYPGNDTALDTAGGQSLVINGGVFNEGITVTIGGTTPSSITRNSATQLTVTTPAKSAATYALVFTNTDGGTATATNAVSYNGVPAFTNAAGSLGSIRKGESINVSAAATEPDGGAITYAITSGALPSGVSLNTSTGAITGTAPDVNAVTTSNFTVTATDNENQSTARAYSITITIPLPSDDFKIVTYTGNSASDNSGTTQNITGVGFKPDFVWIKRRDGAEAHFNFDSTRGVTKTLYPNSTDQSFTETHSLTSFNNDGFTVGGYNGTNNNGETFVAYCWRLNGGTTSSNSDGTITSTVQVNADKGFSIVQFTNSSPGSNTRVGHGLGATPDAIFVKRTDGTEDWYVYHQAAGTNKASRLNSTINYATATNLFGTVNSTVFNPSFTGATNQQIIAYCFRSIEGYSKFGSYTGNGATQIIETGFKPGWILIKSTVGNDNWRLYDTTRGITAGGFLKADTTDGENTSNAPNFTILSNGFEITAGGTTVGNNANGNLYTYYSFAEDPNTTTPTLANSFNVKAYTGTGNAQVVSGFNFNLSEGSMVWAKSRGASANNWNQYDTIRAAKNRLISNSANGQDNSGGLDAFTSSGFNLRGGYDISQAFNYISYAWKADNEPTIAQDTADVNAKAIYTLESNANDVTTNYNATASGITHSSGKFGNAATYSGSQANSGSKIYVSNSVYGASTSVFSVSLWLKCTNTSGEIPIAGNGGTIGGTSGYAVYLESGKLSLTFRTNPNQVFYGNTKAINDNAWHHIALTCDDGDFVLYLDGNVHVSGSTTYWAGNPTPSFDTYFGNRWNRSEAGVIAGQIDQIRIYDKPLTAASITNLYNETTAQNSTLNIGTKYGTSIKAIVSANQNAGFSIVKWTGNGVASTQIPHGLSAAPNMIISKDLSNSKTWQVYHSGAGSGAKFGGHLDSSSAFNTSAGGNGGWDIPSATTLKFSNGSSSINNLNQSGAEIIAYCFHDVAGYQKFGSYVGNNNATGPTVTTGFQPNFVLIKRRDGTSNWNVYDTTRDSSNPSGPPLYPNLNNAEGGTQAVNFLSNGFQPAYAGGDVNENNGNYIYWAIKTN
jgi:uncharacterized protein (DUF736 family)